MQDVGVDVDVLGGGDVELHCNFVIAEEQARDVLHLGPIWAAILPRDADVIPSGIGAGNNDHGRAVDG